jgi:hypothetical protein
MAGVKLNTNPLANIFPVCINSASLERDMEIHGYIITGFQSRLFVESALINMYAKCGIIDQACTIFDIIP